MSIVSLWLLLVGLLFPASAADPTGVLKLTSSAASAEVFVDGASVGNAPVTKYLPTGPHKVRVVADNFEPFVRQVEIQVGRTVDLAAALVPGPGSIEFTGPAGASVSISGQAYSVPVRVPSPGAGPFAWTAQAPSFETTNGALQLVKGRNYLVNLELESSEGVVEVLAKPVGALVKIDGVEIGPAPAKAKGLPPGPHGVEVSQDGYGTAYRLVDTSKGGRGSAEVNLSKSAIEVVVNTGGDAAVVRFSGVEVGTGSSVKVSGVGRGRIEVTITEGEHVATGKVDVPPSGTLTLRQSGTAVIEQKPLTSQWGFWAAVGGGAVAAGTAVAVVVVANEPEPAPVGDVVVTLP